MGKDIESYLYFLAIEIDGVFTIYGFNSIDDVLDNAKMSEINGNAWFLTNDSSLISKGKNEKQYAKSQKGKTYQ